MKEFRPLRTALCIYEGLRLALLVGVFILLQPEGIIPFPWLALITPGAMFLLMTLFWRLNMFRYRVYAPLYLAGKGLSVITTMFWLFLAKSYMINRPYFHGTKELIEFITPRIVVFLLLLGDMLSAWLVNIMMRGDVPDNYELSGNSD